MKVLSLMFLILYIKASAFNICGQDESFKLNKTNLIEGDYFYSIHTGGKYCKIFSSNDEEIDKIEFINDDIFYIKPFPSLYKIKFKSADMISHYDIFSKKPRELFTKDIDEALKYIKDIKINRTNFVYENEKFKLVQNQECGIDNSYKKCINRFEIIKKKLFNKSKTEKCITYKCIEKLLNK